MRIESSSARNRNEVRTIDRQQEVERWIFVVVIEPPVALACVLPSKIWAIFSFLSAPWDRRVGFGFNVIAGGVALWFLAPALLL